MRTRIRELGQLGLPDWAATNFGNTRKGPWRSVKVLNNGLGKHYLRSLGLVSIAERYSQLRAGLMNRRMWTRMSGGVRARGRSRVPSYSMGVEWMLQA